MAFLRLTARRQATLATCLSALLSVASLSSSHAVAAPVWQDPDQTPEARTNALLKAMTQKEKLALVTSALALKLKSNRKPEGAIGSAAYVPPIPRLGIPALQISDAGLGVTNPLDTRPGDGATSLPSGQALSGSFDETLAREAGAMIGTEARHRGFNVLLAGGMNLVRDPRGGRNFEYLGEDPILSGQIAAATVDGVQSRHVISTVKHYALNAYETGRMRSSADIAIPALQESDLLAFRIAVERGHPGSIMCAYNKVNGDYACESAYLLDKVLRKEWGYDGFVMSDWGAVHDGAKAAHAGLDQDSAVVLDAKAGFVDAVRRDAETTSGAKRLDEKLRHILAPMFANGLFDDHARPTETPDDIAAHRDVARRVEEEGAVLLRNVRDTLPLSTHDAHILIIGGHADKGVIAGGGSSAVLPRGGNAVPDPVPASLLNMPHPTIYDPDAPVDALRAALPNARIEYIDGSDAQKAATLAKKADAVVIFATKWQGETLDAADLSLDPATDALIGRVADANDHVTVVLETGNPVTMPWLSKVGAVLEAWYPGSAGGKAIANLLTGKANPSGRTTTTWPRSLKDLPRPVIPGAGHHTGVMSDDESPIPFLRNIDFNIEGADVGYRWFARQSLATAFPFGFGLSYTSFAHDAISVSRKGKDLVAKVTLRNTGNRPGDDIVQIYAEGPDHSPLRLAGYTRVPLSAGEQKTVEVTLSPYAVSRFDDARSAWKRIPGQYRFIFAHNAEERNGPASTVQIEAR
ncbi:beta-glucosidase [Swaminathania salitolerans]|uniref:Glycosyl hydrolase n=1 Tax=Swaminathania salitolerans TaxID=182838 RepID=A0A511BWH3_9PROT|nr:glycoside hydrolase family 3 C-terminal domain-containing protein [Swaminathania salitolerans]GBQ11135.1 beta-glucosidase-related glycosidase [Swaminathania salitolerans LMG 21291]GEL02358.1 glycosyl hydrolase [Swaminathania salitolerans]